MPRNLKSIFYSATAAATFGNGGTAGAALTGDSLQMELTDGPTRIVHWSQLNQTFGGVRLIHPSGHDTSEGLKYGVAAGDLGNLLNRGIPYELQSSETMKLQVYGTAVSGDVTTGLMILERDMPGSGGRYIGFDTLRKRRHRQVNLKVTLAAAAAGYGTEETLKSEIDILYGGRDYAWLGASVDVNCAGVGIRAPEWGNSKLYVPGNAVDAWPRGSDFWCEMSRVFNGAYIPVFNGTNAGQIFAGFVADENLTALEATFHLMLLKD